MTTKGPTTNLGFDLQGAIFTALNRDTQLVTLLGGNKIYDMPPDNETFPYVLIGDEDVEDWNTHTFIGFKGSTTVDVWIQDQNHRGLYVLKGIMHRIWQRLNNREMNLPGRKQINFRCDSQSFVKQPDGLTVNGVMKFIFIYGGNDNE